MDSVDHHKRTNKAILWLLYLVLIIPLASSFFVREEKPLQGAYVQPEDMKFSIKDWLSGDFQAGKEKYLESGYGLHNLYVRASSEFDFRFLSHPHARFVVVGKDNYLFEKEYIDAYYGRDFVGKDSISNILQRLKCVQDTMRKLNKLVVPVLAAGKGWYYPEYFPERFRSQRLETNYDAYASFLREHEMDYLDFNQVFIEQKNKSTHPLYPQFGIHWSNYAGILMFDSLLHYIESKTGRVLPDLVIDSVEVSDSLRYPDNDIIRSLNLLSDLPTFPMAYPRYHVDFSRSGTDRLKLLVVADSFWWYIYSTGLPDHVFSSRFWFYNEEMYPESGQNITYVPEHDYFKSIREADVILILHTPSTLYKFANGFDRMLYETWCAPDHAKEELQSMKGIILSEPAWIQQVRKKAAARNISVDSMLNMDARYMMEQKKSPKNGD